jgi:hypothetical protein
MLKIEEAKLLKLVIVQVKLVVVRGFVLDLEQFHHSHVVAIAHALEGCLGEVDGQGSAVVEIGQHERFEEL